MMYLGETSGAAVWCRGVGQMDKSTGKLCAAGVLGSYGGTLSRRPRGLRGLFVSAYVVFADEVS